MGLRDDCEVGKPPLEASRPERPIGPISSLNEAWFHTLDKCLIDSPLSEVILPLMHNCFSAGRCTRLFLLRKGHGDQLASDIAGIVMEEPQQ